jgi:hypothetical protein
VAFHARSLAALQPPHNAILKKNSGIFGTTPIPRREFKDGLY